MVTPGSGEVTAILLVVVSAVDPRSESNSGLVTGIPGITPDTGYVVGFSSVGPPTVASGGENPWVLPVTTVVTPAALVPAPCVGAWELGWGQGKPRTPNPKPRTPVA